MHGVRAAVLPAEQGGEGGRPHQARRAVRPRDRGFSEGLALERELQQQLFQSDDAKEGLKAYVEKRKPNFSWPSDGLLAADCLLLNNDPALQAGVIRQVVIVEATGARGVEVARGARLARRQEPNLIDLRALRVFRMRVRRHVVRPDCGC